MHLKSPHWFGDPVDFVTLSQDFATISITGALPWYWYPFNKNWEFYLSTKFIAVALCCTYSFECRKWTSYHCKPVEMYGLTKNVDVYRKSFGNLKNGRQTTSYHFRLRLSMKTYGQLFSNHLTAKKWWVNPEMF